MQQEHTDSSIFSNLKRTLLLSLLDFFLLVDAVVGFAVLSTCGCVRRVVGTIHKVQSEEQLERSA